jgi:hypothetical protein
MKTGELLSRLESRFGIALTAAVIAVLLLAASALYVRPAVHGDTHGKVYAKLAENPFGNIDGNKLAFRMLTPLISWLIGLRGEWIILTNLLFGTVLLMCLYIMFRRIDVKPADALFSCAVIAFSMVHLSTVHEGGYCDALTYLLMLLMWGLRRQKLTFFILFFLALLNRESILFLIPWFVWVHYRGASAKTAYLVRTALGFGICVAMYALFRELVSAHGEVEFTAEYYLRPLLNDPAHWILQAFPYQPIGLFTVFKLLWVFPVMAMISMWKSGIRSEVYSGATLLVCCCAQMIFAFDSSRMLTMVYPVMLTSLIHLFNTDAFEFRKWAMPLFWINLVFPHLYTAAKVIEYWPPTALHLVRVLVTGAQW